MITLFDNFEGSSVNLRWFTVTLNNDGSRTFTGTYR